LNNWLVAQIGSQARGIKLEIQVIGASEVVEHINFGQLEASPSLEARSGNCERFFRYSKASNMDHLSSSRSKSLSVWLLCSLLFTVAAFAPNCPYCDDAPVSNGSAHALAAPSLAHPHECIGACLCCGFQLLRVEHALDLEISLLPHVAVPITATRLSGWFASPLQPPRS
jgi:hypothetical protein